MKRNLWLSIVLFVGLLSIITSNVEAHHKVYYKQKHSGHHKGYYGKFGPLKFKVGSTAHRRPHYYKHKHRGHGYYKKPHGYFYHKKYYYK